MYTLKLTVFQGTFIVYTVIYQSSITYPKLDFIYLQ